MNNTTELQPHPNRYYIVVLLGYIAATQLQHARNGTVTPAMNRVAVREQCDPETVRAAVAAGKAVIPANHGRDARDPMIIGREFGTKVNANIGNSVDSSDTNEELTKLHTQ